MARRRKTGVAEIEADTAGVTGRVLELAVGVAAEAGESATPRKRTRKTAATKHAASAGWSAAAC